MSESPDQIKANILALVREYSALVHGPYLSGNEQTESRRSSFDPGIKPVPYAGRVFDSDEVEAAVGAVLDFWLTLGPEGEAFEKEFAAYLGVRHSVLVNSGSSANLLAFSALTSPKLKERQIRPGDEVITAAAGFPTTVAPIIQNRAVPVFIDSDPMTANANCSLLEEAYAPGKTKAVMMAHTLGNPFDLTAVRAFCDEHDLWLIEDNCDALGACYLEPKSKQLRLTGTFGDLSTQSFYPPHHLTLGEGGAVNILRSSRLKSLVESFRDWGRDCWCASGNDNTCGIRFSWQLGDLPQGYDHKYTYSHLGYNLKPLDIQAAIGRQQLKKVTSFIAARRRNWEYLRRGLADLNEFFDFMLPTHACGWNLDGFVWEPAPGSNGQTRCQPSWFGFMFLIRPDAPFTRTDFAQALETAKIGNRMLFGGNLVRQPAFVNLKNQDSDAFRIVGELHGADRLMNHGIFIGVYPGLTDPMLDYMIEVIHSFVSERCEQSLAAGTTR